MMFIIKKSNKYLWKRGTLILFGFLFCALLKAKVPVGYYYLAKGKENSELKTALHKIVSNSKMLMYGSGAESTWYGFYQIDRDSVNNSVIDRYSSDSFYFGAMCESVSGMHIEHSLPKSWWGALSNNAYRDLHHLFPAEATINSLKNNNPLGEVAQVNYDNGVSKVGLNAFGDEYQGKCFEPADEYKGDFARAYLYVSTAYEDYAPLWNSPMMENNIYPVWKEWALELLLKWHRNDPVSALEKVRMEKIYELQGNRNPFIDYPDLVEYIWGSEKNSTYNFPTETEAFLITPNRWSSVDFGVLLKGDSCKYELDFLGVNLKSDIIFDFLIGNQGFNVEFLPLQKEEERSISTINITFSAIETGIFLDTLQILGGGLNSPINVPLSVVVSSDFVALMPTFVTATSANLNWMKQPDADYYLVDLYKGDSIAGDLMLSAYVEGTSWNKGLEIYNGTGCDIDLSKYSLRKQNNGIGTFGFDFPLSGVLKRDSTFFIIHGSADAADLLTKADCVTPKDYTNIMAFNGNDAIALYREGILVDIIGYKDMTDNWGENVVLKRKRNVTQPNEIFDMQEWDVYSKDDFSSIGKHSIETNTALEYVLKQCNVGNNTTHKVEGLKPNEKYTYCVYVCSGGKKELSKNTKRLHTSDLMPPLALDATDVYTSSFVANWELNDDAEAYYLTLFKMQGEPTMLKEGFDNLDTNGEPLPSGWQGTISGNYASATNSGELIPSAAFKNNAEYLQTPIFSMPITSLSFMSKFVSGGEGSYLLLESFVDDVYKVIDTIYFENNTKKISSYAFEKSENVRAVRFTYNKVKGNLALDDVSISYGASDSIFILKNEMVVGDSYLVLNLTPETEYFYYLQSVCSDYISEKSNVITVLTKDLLSKDDVVNNSLQSDVKVYASDKNIIIEGAEFPISVFNIWGQKIKQENVSQVVSVSVLNAGVYIVCVGSESYKVIVY